RMQGKYHESSSLRYLFPLQTIESRPTSENYPKQLITVGDHIRAWRINNKLSQAEISKRLDVCEDTIVGWETRNIKPTVRQIPGIVKLIGCLPIEIDTSTFGGRITMHRNK